MTKAKRSDRAPSPLILLGVWVLLITGSFCFFNWYNTRSGTQNPSETNWPKSTSMIRQTSLYTLVLFLHPKCVCSVATVHELKALLADLHKPLQLIISFYRPLGSDPKWAKTALRGDTAKIPGVSIVDDEGGTLARKFGAATSGQTYLYNPEGHLTFKGGITETRGHIGNNIGRRSIASAVNLGTPIVESSSVYGCGLFNEKESE